MDIHIGLIGVGRMGKVFGSVLASAVPGVKLAAVADQDAGVAKEAAARFGVDGWYTHYLDLLEKPDIEAVVIVTPTSTHAGIIVDAAEAGKHIFSEKPLSLSLAECDRAIKAVQNAGVKLQMGFMRRFDPAYAMAKQKIEQGSVGTPVLFRACSRDPKRTSLEYARRENSGGLILDMGVHDFDLARWLMGAEVAEVHAWGGVLVFPELKEAGDIDNVVINLKFANGALGAIDLSRNAVYGYDIRTEVLGSDGGVIIGQLQQTATLVMTRQGVSYDTVPYFLERFGQAYAQEIRDFAECIREDRAPKVTGLDARQATAIGIAATRSLDENRTVRLDELQA